MTKVLQSLLYSFFLILLFLSLLRNPLYSDEYRNINGFFGERAPGMGGAYTAISDDPSGAYYNPAGLSYTYDNSISLSTSNLTIGKKTYVDVFGPGQGYVRDFQNYIPNFFGVVKELEDGSRVAFSIVNPINENYQRNDFIQNSLYFPSIAQIKNYERQYTNNISAGLSYSQFLIPNRLSYGVTFYGFEDSYSSVNSIFVQFTGVNNYVSTNFSETSVTRGLIPVFGLMYTPIDKLSFGLSLRRILNVSETYNFNQYELRIQEGISQSVFFLEGNQDRRFGDLGFGYVIGPGYNTKVPETTEVRLGTAYFPDNQFLVSADIIYTSRYSRQRDNTEYIFDQDTLVVSLTDREIPELQRFATTNFALGLEYFITEFFSMRAGSFTNYSNYKSQSWIQNSINGILLQILPRGEFPIGESENVILTYRLPELQERVRNEYLNTTGYTFGISVATQRASFGLNFIREVGRGNSNIDPLRPNQRLLFESNSIYLVISSREN